MHTKLPVVAFRWLLIPFLVVMAAMSIIGAPLKSQAAPHGIVTLELCAFTSDCAEILRTWTAPQREYAMLSLGLDYLYLLLYPAFIASALMLVARGLSGRFQSTATFLAWLLALAGMADAVENYCLIQMLSTGRVAEFAVPAAVCASGKFAVIALALLFLAVAVALRLGRQRDA